MLFNSTTFIFVFLPIVFFGYFLIARKSHDTALILLATASIFFYAFWNIKSLPVLMISICFNYWLGRLISNQDLQNRKTILIFAIAFNLCALAYYKYVNFFIDNINDLRDYLAWEPYNSLNILLPIGISFFTFTQIAYLIDSYQDKIKERNFIKYILFVSFFPHLLAGPLLHHRQMMPQFSMKENFSIQSDKVATGILIFAIGLSKKILIADTLNSYLSTFYNSVAQGAEPNFLASWIACIAYTFQLYFDFSGYSDMAVGVALLFGIRMPFNFNSPLRATSIIDFWQRWHITLTKYVGDYLYMPLTLQFMRLSLNTSASISFLISLMLPTVIVFIIIGL